LKRTLTHPPNGSIFYPPTQIHLAISYIDEAIE
jgi:hypothetical protein